MEDAVIMGVELRLGTRLVLPVAMASDQDSQGSVVLGDLKTCSSESSEN